MAIRLDDLPLDDTKQILLRIMPHLNQDERILFLVPAGQGKKVELRMRVMLSRARNRLKLKSARKMNHFKLHCTIHPHTEGGIRYDAVVMWRAKNATHYAQEMLEDLLEGQSNHG